MGRCRMYECQRGQIVERFPDQYLTLFPISIETMPMLHYFPRGKFLQLSTVGCNFRCSGCISEVLVEEAGQLWGALMTKTPEEVVNAALGQNCLGIVFCVNEPTVSLPTFQRVARKAKEAGLLVGCSTNGYFTESALNGLLPMLDFVNIGLKGASQQRYKACGASSPEPVLRNIQTLYQKGVHIEVAAIYMKGFEEEIKTLATTIAGISPDIPFQVMRFVPFGDADMASEPAIKASEHLCDQLKNDLRYVYLFNSPGTEYLSTKCPSCSNTVFTREFFGPMGARLRHHTPHGTCGCGEKPIFRGDISKVPFEEEGFFGGYRMTRAFEMIHAVLVCLGVSDPVLLSKLWLKIVRMQYLKTFHEIIQLPERYREIISFLAYETGTEAKGNELSAYIEEKMTQISAKLNGAKRPKVYYSMGYPLFALNSERFETNLVELAGGTCLNKTLSRKGKPGITISPEEFMNFNPDFIFISGFLTCPVSDFHDYCRDKDLMVNAVTNSAVHGLPPSWDFGSPRWILGLMFIANVLHPDLFAFDLKAEANQFYHRFYGKSFSETSLNRSFYRA